MGTIHERLRAAREMAEVTATNLSLAAGLSHGFVALIEDQKRGISADTAVKLARVLGVSLDWLLRGEGKPPKPADVRGSVARASEAKGAA